MNGTPSSRHDCGQNAFCSRNSSSSDVWDLNCLFTNDSRLVGGVPVACVTAAAGLGVDADVLLVGVMVLGVSLQNASEDLVIERVVEAVAQGVLVGKLLRDVAGVRPRVQVGVRIGGVRAVDVVGSLRIGVRVLSAQQ